MPSVSWFVAGRYLFSRERKALVSAITLISVTGVAVGVAALIVVIGVMDGAWDQLYSKMTNLFPHIQVRGSMEDEDFLVPPELLKGLRARPDVVFAEPVLQKKAMLQAGDTGEEGRGVLVIGLDPAASTPLYKEVGGNQLQSIKLERHEILLGAPLADKLQATTGSTVRLLPIDPARAGLNAGLKGVMFHLKGIYSTNFYHFDFSVAFVNTEQLREIYNIKPGLASMIYIRLKEPFKANEVKRELMGTYDYPFEAWTETNGDFFGALKLQKLMLFIILLLIILVAAFNIIGTLVLMVIEKTREVGILRAMGASERMVQRIFLLNGVLIGLVGTGVGLALGVGLAALIPYVPLELPAAIYNLDHLPVKIKGITVTLIVISSLLICTLASLFPARQAAKLNPVEALRYD